MLKRKTNLWNGLKNGNLIVRSPHFSCGTITFVKENEVQVCNTKFAMNQQTIFKQENAAEFEKHGVRMRVYNTFEHHVRDLE